MEALYGRFSPFWYIRQDAVRHHNGVLLGALGGGASGTDLLASAAVATPPRHVIVLLGAGVLTGAGQVILRRLSSGNGIDTTAATWFYAGRLPVFRTLGSAILSVLVVGMGASLGREGAPKQAGAIFVNFFAGKARLFDEQRRLLVACAARAGMAAAYGVPLAGALFALEVNWQEFVPVMSGGGLFLDMDFQGKTSTVPLV